MSLQSLTNTIARIVANNKNIAQNNIKQGQVVGNGVLVDGINYNYSVAVDVDIEDSDMVYVMFNDSHSRAVVIGK